MTEAGDAAAQKRRLRRVLRARCRALPPEQAARAAEAIARHASRDPAFARAERVVLYAALPGEVPTAALWQLARDAGKPVLLPRLAGETLEFAPARGPEELVPGPLGVREPPPEHAAAVLQPSDLLFVPGLAFDAAGGRLGRGGGHFDRALSGAAAAAVAVGVAYSFQLLERVPQEAHDRLVDGVVTEDGLRWRRALERGR